MELIEQSVYMFYEFDFTQRLASFAVCFYGVKLERTKRYAK